MHSLVCKTLWVVEVIKWDLRRSLQEPPAARVQSHMHRRAMRTIKISSWLLEASFYKAFSKSVYGDQG